MVKKDESKAAKAEVVDAPAVEPATSDDWPDVADQDTQTNVVPTGPPPANAASAPPLEPEPLAAVTGYTTVVPVPGSDGPRSQQEYDAGQR